MVDVGFWMLVWLAVRPATRRIQPTNIRLTFRPRTLAVGRSAAGYIVQADATASSEDVHRPETVSPRTAAPSAHLFHSYSVSRVLSDCDTSASMTQWSFSYSVSTTRPNSCSIWI